jgi:YfiR/HmsC-like
MKKTFLLLFSLILYGSVAVAQTQESKIQALFILKFIENVSWPQDRKDIVIGVVGKSETLTELESRLKLKNPNGIVIKKITPSEASTCDAVYVPSSEDKVIGTITASINDKSVLIITESDFSRKGSGISFIEEAGRMNFIVNKNAIEAKGMRVSNSLLTLGKKV